MIHLLKLEGFAKCITMACLQKVSITHQDILKASCSMDMLSAEPMVSLDREYIPFDKEDSNYIRMQFINFMLNLTTRHQHHRLDGRLCGIKPFLQIFTEGKPAHTSQAVLDTRATDVS